MNNKAVFCIAKSLEQAERIVAKLESSGFSTDAISVLYTDVSNELVRERGDDLTTFDTKESVMRKAKIKVNRNVGHEKHSKAPEGAAIGGTTGGIIGGTIGLLAGLGTLAIPGMGAFIAAGPIMAALAGSGVGGSIGLLTGALVGLGIPEYEAVHYAEKLKQGTNVLISVHTNNSDEINKAKKIFESLQAEDIATSAEVALPGSKNKW